MGPAPVAGLIREPRYFPDPRCRHRPGGVLDLAGSFLGLGHQATLPVIEHDTEGPVLVRQVLQPGRVPVR